MRTEIPAASERPAMTADHMRRTITKAYKAYETSDRETIEDCIAEDFSFTSPYDDAIDRETYFTRCWPNHETTAAMKIERVFIEGDAAYVTYSFTSITGRTSRNTEYLTFRAGQIASVEVYFGPDYRNGKLQPATPPPRASNAN